MRQLIILFLLTLFTVPNFVLAQTPPNCAPGDKPIPIYDADGTTIKGYDGCLYGTDQIPGYMGNTNADPKVTARIVVNIVLGFLGLVVVAMIIYGGFFWLTAAGSEERVTKGKHTLAWAAIGAVVISIAWTISSYILKIGKTIG